MSQDISLLPSATRTASTSASNMSTPTFTGVYFYLNITAASGTGGLKVSLRAVDPGTGQISTLFAATTAITATGLYVYALYPGSGASLGAQSANVLLPATWQAAVLHSDGSNYTYSLDASLSQ